MSSTPGQHRAHMQLAEQAGAARRGWAHRDTTAPCVAGPAGFAGFEFPPMKPIEQPMEFRSAPASSSGSLLTGLSSLSLTSNMSDQ